MRNLGQNTYLGKPLEHFVRVVIAYEEGQIVNGQYVFDYIETEGTRCTREDFPVTDEEEAALTLEGDAWCKPKDFSFKLSG